MQSLRDFYRNKKVLITGHTGFKGTWLAMWLHHLEAKVIGVALDPKTDKDIYVLSDIGKYIQDYREDIRNLTSIQEIFRKEKPEIVFHLAAQALVIQSYEEPIPTYETNIMGTVNVLECIRFTDSVVAGIMITSDKCYENNESGKAYKESDPLGGFDPYSSSKGASELVINAYRSSFTSAGECCGIASARAGNVIGGGDWAKDRLIPDCVRSFEKGDRVFLRNPNAVRPWQHVLEPLRGYMILARLLYNNPEQYNEAWNFGPIVENHTVFDIVNSFIKHYRGGDIAIDNSSRRHEARLLNLDISKANNRLGWEPVLNLDDSLKLTAEWYKNYQNQSVYELTMSQIEEYAKL